jgi:hypothetical protein
MGDFDVEQELKRYDEKIPDKPYTDKLMALMYRVIGLTPKLAIKKKDSKR